MSVFFSTIAGNRPLLEDLGQDILDGRLPHAHIIEGEEGSGRRSIALAAAAALCCNRPSGESFPCGECPACRKIFEGKTPDVIRVSPGRERQSIGVDTARLIKSDVISLPNDFERKIYIIEEADKMTPQAQNALLLTLEEPPKYAYFFLICRSASSMLETVRSRAPTLRTRPLDDASLARYITGVSKEAVALERGSPEEFAEIVRAASGCIGGALSLLDPKARRPLLERRRIARDFISVSSPLGPASARIALLSRFSSKREEAISQLECAILALRDLLALKKTENAPLLFWTNRGAALDISDGFTLAGLIRLIRRTTQAAESLGRNANLRLTLINLIISPDLTEQDDRKDYK